MNSFSKYILLLSILLLAKWHIVFAQKVEIKWAEEFKVQGVPIFEEIVGCDNVYYYKLTKGYKRLIGSSTDGPDYIFEQYTMDHKVTMSQILLMETPLDKKGDFQKMYQLDGKFILLFTYFNSKENRNALYAVTVDKTGAQTKPILVGEMPAKKRDYENSFTLTVSSDKTKLLVTSFVDYAVIGKPRLKYRMLNGNLEKLWEKEIELSYENDLFKMRECIIDDKGNVFMLGCYKINRKDDTVFFKMYAYDYKRDKVEEVNISFDKSLFVEEVKIFEDSTGLRLVGFYYNQNPKKDRMLTIAGVFCSEINSQTFALESQRILPFNQNTSSMFVTDNKASNGERVISSFKMIDVKANKDGALQIIAENAYIQLTTFTQPSAFSKDPTPASSPTYYSYGSHHFDIMVLEFTKEGELEWCARIPKYHMTPDESMVKPTTLAPNFLLLTDKENRYFVYHDDTYKLRGKVNSSIEQKNPDVMLTDDSKKYGIIVAKIDSKGQVTRELYSDVNDKSKTVFNAKNCWQMKDGRILISAESTKMRRFGFLSLKDIR